MKGSLFIRTLVQFRVYLGLASATVIIFYLVYNRVLHAGFISTLGEEASFNVLTRIIDFTFILAITTLTLSILSYTLPKILPASLFEPIPKIEYAVAVARMYDPYEISPISKSLDSIEIYPGFPYYSHEGDHPSLWPLRVLSDRQSLFKEYQAFLSRYPMDRILADLNDAEEVDTSIQIIGGNYSVSEQNIIETIAKLRNLVYNKFGGDSKVVEKIFGHKAFTDFVRIEEARSKLRKQFPNRFALIRIKNIGKRDAQNVIIEFDLFGELYDIAVDTNPEQVHKAEYDLAKKCIVVEQILPDSLVEIRLWYRYFSVKERVFPDKRDFILELTQGISINNIAVSGGDAVFSEKLMVDFSVYERLYLGSAIKKDDYSEDLTKYFEQNNELLAAHMEQYEEEHPSFNDVSTEWLAASERADESVNAIWVKFTSKAGNRYKAVHVFHHPEGPYILLTSTDKSQEDFKQVRAILAQSYQGSIREQISDRGDDICAVISIENGFTQKGVAKQVDTFFRNTFDQVAIETIHY